MMASLSAAPTSKVRFAISSWVSSSAADPWAPEVVDIRRLRVAAEPFGDI